MKQTLRMPHTDQPRGQIITALRFLTAVPVPILDKMAPNTPGHYLIWFAGLACALLCMACDVSAHPRASLFVPLDDEAMTTPAETDGSGQGQNEAPPAPDLVYSMAWRDVAPGCPHITSMQRVTRTSIPSEIAAAVRRLPHGKRGILFWRDVMDGLLEHPLDRCRTADDRPTHHPSVWPERGPRDVRKRLERFFRELRTAGAQLDLLVLDFEKGYQWNRVRGRGDDWIRAIEDDHRFPLLAHELGFDDLNLITWGNQYCLKWNSVMRRRVDEALSYAVFDAARRYYPDIEASNYGSCRIDPLNAQPDGTGRNPYFVTPGFGTHDSHEFYTFISGAKNSRLDGEHPLGDSPFAGLLLDINKLRAIIRSTSKPIHPWVSAYSYIFTEPDGRRPAIPRRMVVNNTDYYNELIYHLALHGIKCFIYWNPDPWEPEHDPQDFPKPSDDLRLEHLLGEINSRLGGERHNTLSTEPVAWDRKVIASGFEVNDRIVWRFTFAPGIDEVSVMVDGKPFSIKREPHGVGAWFVHPANRTLLLPGAGVD